ncbi:MAG: hypothetical protein QF741_02980 [Candidatus Peribacteraceae bacterium]|jgi:hypothetical protein|nr:hypothetical protein [Candidatus Peribacteraceae bacterium]MDP7454474.1 hypothetical protein [Candidatus Peribacteraceae bacterium]|tara:strand:- start:66 stop:944 length:879 start_codon:yes stop_codon:yes gene_type:complete
MPLKHATETVLVFVLGLVIAIFGVLAATLPPLPQGGLPWVVLLAIAVLYPLSLTHLFKKNRADYAFRWLHWFPVLILLLWLIIEIVAKVYEPARSVQAYYQWGWSFGLVAIGILGIMIFCLRVIRRRLPRTLLLLAVFVPFAVLAFAGEGQRNWNGVLASALWDASLWNDIQQGISGTGSVEVAFDDKEAKNLSTSENPAEEAWRERLREFERRRQEIAQQANEEKPAEPVPAPEPAPEPEPATKTGTGTEYREAKTEPVALPSSGAGVGLIAMTMISGYCGLVHRRAKRRV